MPDAALWVTYGKINSNPLTSKRIVVQPLPTNTPTTLCLDEEAGRRAAHMKWISSGPYVCSEWDQSATIKLVIMKGRGDPGVWAPSIWLVFLCVLVPRPLGSTSMSSVWRAGPYLAPVLHAPAKIERKALELSAKNGCFSSWITDCRLKQQNLQIWD